MSFQAFILSIHSINDAKEFEGTEIIECESVCEMSGPTANPPTSSVRKISTSEITAISIEWKEM
jgi:hypothetical protein